MLLRLYSDFRFFRCHTSRLHGIHVDQVKLSKLILSSSEHHPNGFWLLHRYWHSCVGVCVSVLRRSNVCILVRTCVRGW